MDREFTGTLFETKSFFLFMSLYCIVLICTRYCYLRLECLLPPTLLARLVVFHLLMMDF